MGHIPNRYSIFFKLPTPKALQAIFECRFIISKKPTNLVIYELKTDSYLFDKILM